MFMWDGRPLTEKAHELRSEHISGVQHSRTVKLGRMNATCSPAVRASILKMS